MMAVQRLCFVFLAALVVHSSSVCADDSDPSGSSTRVVNILEVGAGPLNVSTNRSVEINKEGLSTAGGWHVLRSNAKWNYGLGLGFSQQDAKNSDSGRGVKQRYRVSAPLLDVRGAYEVIPSLLLGLNFRSLYGIGTEFNQWNKDHKAYAGYLGPRVEWFRFFDNWRIHAFAMGMTSLKNADRRILDIQVGVGIGLVLDQAKEPVPVPPVAPAPPEEPKPETAPPPPAIVEQAPQKITLNSKLVSFEINSTKLKPVSAEFLKKFGKIMTEYGDVWEQLEISGHTDASGKVARNLVLSEGRANSVKKAFVAEGSADSRLKAIGYADKRLLPGLAPTAAEHRRVELEFGDLQGERAKEFQEAINQLINEYQGKL